MTVSVSHDLWCNVVSLQSLNGVPAVERLLRKNPELKKQVFSVAMTLKKGLLTTVDIHHRRQKP